MTRWKPAVALSACLAMVGTAHAVTITSGSADTYANATASRVASTSGTINDDPLATLGTAGVITSDAEATAGPIDPDPNNANFPGTLGVSTASADATLNIFNGGMVISVDLLAENDFRTMDGGNYTADSEADFEVEFTVAVDTPYQFSGSYALTNDDNTTTWGIQLTGSGGAPGFIFNQFSDSELAGPVSFSGTLLAGRTYIYSGQVDVLESISPGTGSFNESSRLNATLMIPEPTTAGLLGLATLAVLNLRRRQA